MKEEASKVQSQSQNYNWDTSDNLEQEKGGTWSLGSLMAVFSVSFMAGVYLLNE